MKKYMVFTIFVGLVFMPYMAHARVSGPCANCHTMHASQTPWPDDVWSDKSHLPKKYLLAKHGSSACVGCHSHNTESTFYDLDGCNVPVVFYKGGSAPTSYLAGGNFWWVKEGLGGNDTKGHNVFEGEGDDLPEAPGKTPHSCGAGSCHVSLSEPDNGCEGCHLNVKHHADDHLNGVSGLVGESGGWYRFLSGHDPENDGVIGYEDGDWEKGLHTYPETNHQGAAQHNEYLGVHDTDGGYGLSELGHTTTAFCTGCHGIFHDEQKSGTSWVRHPSDAIIPDTAGSEYADAGGAYHLYDPLSPVARPSLGGTGWTPSGNISPGTDMVMCLSCHRPHGSPYPDLLRWDYTTQQAGVGGDDKGCFYCHTTKND